MVQVKYVDVDLLPRMPKVWWYGYGKSFQQQMSAFLDMLFGSSIGARIKGAMGSDRSAWFARIGSEVR